MTNDDERPRPEAAGAEEALPPMPDPEGPQHIWIAHGLTPLIDLAPAEEDIVDGVPTLVGSASLTIDGVICAACDQPVDAAEWVCPGPSGAMTDHHWMSFLSLRMTEVEVYRWASMAEDWRPERAPRALTTICILCGQVDGTAETTCPKRQYWAVFGALTEEES